MERSAADLKSKASTTKQRRLLDDVEADLKNLTEEQNADADGQLILKNSTPNDGEKRELTSDEIFEAMERMCNETLSDQKYQTLADKNPNSNTTPGTSQDDDLLKELRYSTILDEEEESECYTFFEMHGSIQLGKSSGAAGSSTRPYDGDKIAWEPITDKSFEAYERMYNNMISDPNSSLYKYLDDEEREQIIAGRKKLNMSPPQVSNIEDDDEMEFSDPMEEFENFFKKTLEDMQKATVDTKNSAEKKQPKHIFQKNTAAASLNQSPKKRRPDTPKKAPSPFKVPLDKKKSADTFNVKPFPKLNVFTKPNKDTSKNQFSHVVSPVGTYMKKTATTPLISNMKSRQINKDLPSRIPLRNLGNESPSKPSTSHKSTLAAGKAQKKLPKKAYISSDLKGIADERTPITIPGGQKIHKYLENAADPAVLRHEGQVKLHKGSNVKLASKKLASSTEALPCDDSSIAQLSVMTGDLSLYTAVDAQKF